MTRARLWKVLRPAEWQAFAAAGAWDGSADDLRDGFIHLSTDEQLSGTLARHFSGEPDLVLVEVGLADDPWLRWEAGRSGERFPHLYRPLAPADILSVNRRGADPQ